MNINRSENKLEVFKFKRRLNYLDSNGKQQKQTCTIYEKFLSDLFPKLFLTLLWCDVVQKKIKLDDLLSDIRLYEVERSSEYSPLVYMSTGELYNRYTCKRNQTNLHYSWLIKAGAKFHCNSTSEIKSLNQ